MQSPRAFEITVLSAEDIRLGDRPLRKKQNTLVSLRTDHANNRQTTSLNVEGGNYPTWNETLRLSTPAFTTWFMVEVQCVDPRSEKLKTVATARVPVSDFREPANYLHFLSYRLKGRDGKRNGIINLSIRVC